MWIITNCRKFLKIWKYQTTYLPPERPVSRSRNNSENKIQKNRWFEIGGEKSTILSPCLFNLYAEHILENAGLEETQAQFKRKIEISIEISMTSDTQMISPIWHKAKNIERAS